MSRGTGKRHARVRYPDQFCLTIDLAGPIKPGLDSTSKGTIGKGLRYMVVAKFTLPKEFVKSYSGKEPPKDGGMGAVGRERVRPDQDDRELPEPSLLPSPEGQCSQSLVPAGPNQDDGELPEPSLLPSPEGQCSQSLVPAGPDQDDGELPEPSLLPSPEDPFLDLVVEPEGGPHEADQDTDPVVIEPEVAGRGHPEFLGASRRQRQDYEDSMYAPSEPDEDSGPDHRTHDEQGGGPRGAVIQDCEAPESTSLLFARALKDNGTMAVKAVIQDIVLYLQSHGLPVYRLHADKGETFSHNIRQWLRDQGIRATWSEPGVPQGNGRAESTVRWVKDQARTLMMSARVPTKLWPTAIEAATAIQRSRVLGWKSSLLAPYGATVVVKQKVFDSSGPRRRERAMETRWMKGQYMGLSSLLDKGHVVYVAPTDEQKEKFMHTFNVRANLVDPGPPEEELVVQEPPRPKRRLVEKTPMGSIEMKRVNLSQEELGEYATARAQALLEKWSYEEAVRLVDELAQSNFFVDVKFGVFRHGGSVGWLTGTQEYPEVTRVLSTMVLETLPEATFTSMWVTRGSNRGQHKDTNNDEKTENYVIPIRHPERGGELWVELAAGDKLQGEVCEKTDAKGKRRYGQLLPLSHAQPLRFSPRRLHEVQPWEGERTVLIAYTPQCMGKLSADMIAKLEGCGFQPPLTQMPEYFMSGDEERAILNKAQVPDPSDQEEDNQRVPMWEDQTEDAIWEMFIETDDGEVKVGNSYGDVGVNVPQSMKVEVNYTYGIEELLKELTAPLEVTHTVCPREAMRAIEYWREAILKEMNSVEVAIKRLKVGTDERRRWLNDPRAQRLPMKLVFTVKPNPKAQLGVPATYFKRKVRLVICGNFAAVEAQSLYTESAPSEAVRAGLVVTTRNGWSVGVIDIVTAFLRTPLGECPDDPVIIATPPRILHDLQLITHQELWALVRALYGLRQSPVLWSRYRDRRMEQMRPPQGLIMKRGRTITSWWSVRDRGGNLVAIILIYVDDYLIMGPIELIRALTAMVQKEWETSDLTILSEDCEVKFLGMELSIRGGSLCISQKGYIDELLRAHGVDATEGSKIPLSKDDATYEVLPDDLPPTPDSIQSAQQVTGELLWLSQRSRPDLSYACCLLSSLTTKAPFRVIAMARKILKYLRLTSGYYLKVVWSASQLILFPDAAFAPLKVVWSASQLILFPDAAFAPSSSRSQTGWVITYGGTPVLWRSTRQATTALSTAEAELNAILEGSVAMLGVESMLLDIAENVDDKLVGSDSMSALCLSSGTGSWRTRHLRIKASWLQEALAGGVMRAQHVPGIRQPADLLTKSLASQRLKDLLRLWMMFDDETGPRVITTSGEAQKKAMVAMICCMLMLGTASATDVEAQPIRTIQLDWDAAGVIMALLMVLGALVVWEFLKWACLEVVFEYAPGASKRRLRKLEKLRDATARAIELEIQKREQGELSSTGSATRTTSRPTRRSSTAAITRRRTPTPRTTRSRTSSPRPRTPSPLPRETMGTSSDPSLSTRPITPPRVRSTMISGSPGDQGHSLEEVMRVLTDTSMLMRVEELREALRLNNQPTSGLKEDLARRLSLTMSATMSTSTSPTMRQLRYILYLWRHKDLQGRVLLGWQNISSRAAISATIHAWSNL